MSETAIPSTFQMTHFYEPEATYVRDLIEGDMAVFDAFFGIERVVAARSLPVRQVGDIECVHLELASRIPRADEQGKPESHRFTVRMGLEPITRWNEVKS